MFLDLVEFEEVKEAPSEKSDYNEWIMIDNGDWVSDGKYEFQECVVQNKESGKYYQYQLQRSGSYYTDYWYSHQDDGGVELNEVIPMEETVTVINWKMV